ncbi:MAG: PEP-CTERM sorting domain-containing protein, partial [Planctomycetaceae bacterium]
MRRNFLKSLMLLAMLAVGQASANAAQLFFNGSVITPLADAGTRWGLVLTYTAGTSFATIDTATLVIGSQTWGTLLGSSNQISLDVTKTQMLIVASFGPSTPGNLGTTFSALSFAVTGFNAASSQNASEANFETIFKNQKTASGTFFTVPSAPVFSGSALTLAGDLNSVPEPASLGLLLGLGAIVGGRYYRRRR